MENKENNGTLKEKIEVMMDKLIALKDNQITKILPLIPKDVTPNDITMWSLGAVLPMCLCLFCGLFIPALLFYIFSCLLDWLDGVLARERKMESPEGALLDPITDKIRYVIPLLMIGGGRIWDPLIIASASLAIGLMLVRPMKRIFPQKQKINNKANRWGKYKALFEHLGLGILIAFPNIRSCIWIVHVLIGFSVLLAFLSFCGHLSKFRLRKEPSSPASICEKENIGREDREPK